MQINRSTRGQSYCDVSNQSTEQLSADALQSRLNELILNGQKIGYSSEYVAYEITNLLQSNPEAAQELDLKADYNWVKQSLLSPSSTDKESEVCQSKGYLNINVSLPMGTMGLALNSCQDVFFYGGVALSSPSFAFTASPGTITEGWNHSYQFGLVAGLVASVDNAFNLNFEGGVVTPGLSISLYYLKKIN